MEVQVIEPMADLAAAMSAAIERLQRQGWSAESAAEFGFTFIHQNGDRRLVVITERDPANGSRQSFNPFRDG